MAKLKDLDQKAEEKGSFLVTVWQLVKFTLVSLIASVTQFGTMNILYLIPAVKALGSREFHWFVFNYDLDAGGMKTFLAVNIANVLAQIVAFFINRKKTFGGTTNIPITLTIYMVFTAAIVCFSAWFASTLSGFFAPLLLEKFTMTSDAADQLAGNIATMICSFLQFIAYFPVSKLLMRNTEKDKEPAAA